LSGAKKRIFPVHYAPGKKLFHIVVKLSDAPGSYSSILNLLGTKVNLIGTSTYSMKDGTAVFSGFSEALSPDLTAKELTSLIMASRAAISAEAFEGEDGVLVDTYHTGYLVGEDEHILMRRDGLIHMFDQVSYMLGSGGDVLLYEEGRALGVRNGETMVKSLGAERVRSQAIPLSRLLAAKGFGTLEYKPGPGKNAFTILVHDCFECAESRSHRKGCNFLRGYLAGDASASFGREYEAEETRCVLKKGSICEFHLRAK